MKIDLVRFSQTALPIARDFDADKNKSLDDAEYKLFQKEWTAQHSNSSPLLMQLHIKTLSDEAKKIAQKYDEDEIKGVLTETELKNFMDECETQGIKNPFKKGTMLKTVLTGEDVPSIKTDAVYQEKPSGFLSDLKIKYKLAKNLAKLNIINFQGSDKFFHAIGNYESMQVGSETSLKAFCEDQDNQKKSGVRTDNDRAEDLYANWLGRQFAKMYPDQNPHELFAPLAPAKFDTKKSQKTVPSLYIKNNPSTVISGVGGVFAMNTLAYAVKKSNITNSNGLMSKIVRCISKAIPKNHFGAVFVLSGIGIIAGTGINKLLKN